MTTAIVHAGPLLRVNRLWWDTLDALVAEHRITTIWHGAHLDGEGHLAGADLGIDAWARIAGLEVAMFPAPTRVYEQAGVDAPKALSRRAKDWMAGQRGYLFDGPTGKEASIKTTETVGLPHLVALLPGDSWTSLIGVEAERQHVKVVRVPMVRDPALPVVINAHHYRDPRADAKGRMPGFIEGQRPDTRPLLPRSSIYIGRKHNGFEASPLANPFTVGEHGDAALPLYKRHLWAKMKARDPAVIRALREITPEHHLVCWCVLPNGYGQCHGHIVAAAWDWWRNE